MMGNQLLPLFLLHFLFFSMQLQFCLSQSPSLYPDFESLNSFKISADSSGKLFNWNASTDVCSWYGISCIQNRVSRVVLEGLGLFGSFGALTSLNQLRVLSLKDNHFSGSIPDLSNLTSLKLLFLSSNNLSGQFPESVCSLTRLYRLDLSNNNLSGQIPSSVNHLTRLLTLRLQNNHLSGKISDLNLLSLQDFNVSGNFFTGIVPKALSGFPKSSFDRNSLLCNSPLPACNDIVPSPSKPGSNENLTSPLRPVGEDPRIVSSSPGVKPQPEPMTTPSSSPVITGNNNGNAGKSGRMSRFAIILIVVGDFAVLVLVSGLLFCYFWKSFKARTEGKNSRLMEGEKIVYSSSPYTSHSGFEKGKMTFIDTGKLFELEDLLKASAEMLGKGGFGTAYKAILEDGNVFTVKRLKEAHVGSRREFEQHMEVLGRIRHSNLVSLKAYYYTREEKLLVYQYMPNGSLFSLLHGNRGPGRTPLDWTTRLKIATGTARGLAFIHEFNHSPKLTHGNLKSTNILLDKSYNPRLTDYALSVFASPSIPPRSNGYRAPELTYIRKASQKADVYAFGVVLLELLTGKSPNTTETNVMDLPKWVQSVVREEWTAEVFDLELMRYKGIEEELVGMLQIALACCSESPNQRPRMSSVLKMVEETRGGEISPYESLDSIAESPSVSEIPSIMSSN